MSLSAEAKSLQDVGDTQSLSDLLDASRKTIFADLEQKNASYFEGELDKLDRWGEDQRSSLKLALKDLEDEIKETSRSARLAANLPEKLRLQRQKRQLDTKRDEAWQAYEKAAKGIEQRKDEFMDEVEQRLKQHVNEQELFRIKWRVE